MDYTLSEWLNLIARWFHVFAGIMWIGQTYLFTWLDGRLNAEGQVWMVHSGGFYVVERQKTPHPSKTLHSFRWEAALTWISGMVLLVLVYYMGGVMIDVTSAPLGVGAATAVGVAVLVIGWVVYDAIWQSPLAGFERAAVALSFVLLAGVTYGLTHAISGRAAYMHVGAMLGTIMTANVWMRILPAQRRMIAAAAAGRTLDADLAARARLRTKHNTYNVVPVVFIMLSHHFPVATYGHRYNWLILSALILAGWGAARWIRRA